MWLTDYTLPKAAVNAIVLPPPPPPQAASGPSGGSGTTMTSLGSSSRSSGKHRPHHKRSGSRSSSRKNSTTELQMLTKDVAAVHSEILQHQQHLSNYYASADIINTNLAARNIDLSAVTHPRPPVTDNTEFQVHGNKMFVKPSCGKLKVGALTPKRKITYPILGC